MNYTDKNTAKEAYVNAKKEYLNNPTLENWKKFCDARLNCMRLGMRL